MTSECPVFCLSLKQKSISAILCPRLVPVLLSSPLHPDLPQSTVSRPAPYGGSAGSLPLEGNLGSRFGLRPSGARVGDTRHPQTAPGTRLGLALCRPLLYHRRPCTGTATLPAGREVAARRAASATDTREPGRTPRAAPAPLRPGRAPLRPAPPPLPRVPAGSGGAGGPRGGSGGAGPAAGRPGDGGAGPGGGRLGLAPSRGRGGSGRGAGRRGESARGRAMAGGCRLSGRSPRPPSPSRAFSCPFTSSGVSWGEPATSSGSARAHSLGNQRIFMR